MVLNLRQVSSWPSPVVWMGTHGILSYGMRMETSWCKCQARLLWTSTSKLRAPWMLRRVFPYFGGLQKFTTLFFVVSKGLESKKVHDFAFCSTVGTAVCQCVRDPIINHCWAEVFVRCTIPSSRRLEPFHGASCGWQCCFKCCGRWRSFCSPSSSNKQQQQGKYHGFEASWQPLIGALVGASFALRCGVGLWLACQQHLQRMLSRISCPWWWWWLLPISKCQSSPLGGFEGVKVLFVHRYQNGQNVSKPDSSLYPKQVFGLFTFRLLTLLPVAQLPTR